MIFQLTESQATLVFMIPCMILMFAAIIVRSSKTGFVAYSIQSMLISVDKKPRWKSDKSKLPQYYNILGLSTILSVLYLLTFDTRLQDLVIGTAMYFLVLAYGLYWMMVVKGKPDQRVK